MGHRHTSLSKAFLVVVALGMACEIACVAAKTITIHVIRENPLRYMGLGTRIVPVRERIPVQNFPVKQANLCLVRSLFSAVSLRDNPNLESVPTNCQGLIGSKNGVFHSFARLKTERMPFACTVSFNNFRRSVSLIHAVHDDLVQWTQRTMLQFDHNPWPFRRNQGLGIQESSIGGFFGGFRLNDEVAEGDTGEYAERHVSRPSDNVVPRPRFRHGSRFGDVYGGLLVMGGTFLGFGSLWGAAIVLAYRPRSVWGWILAAIAASILFLTIVSGAIGCLPGDWHKCSCDGQEHSENRQTFQHPENLSQRTI